MKNMKTLLYVMSVVCGVVSFSTLAAPEGNVSALESSAFNPAEPLDMRSAIIAVLEGSANAHSNHVIGSLGRSAAIQLSADFTAVGDAITASLGRPAADRIFASPVRITLLSFIDHPTFVQLSAESPDARCAAIDAFARCVLAVANSAESQSHAFDLNIIRNFGCSIANALSALSPVTRTYIITNLRERTVTGDTPSAESPAVTDNIPRSIANELSALPPVTRFVVAAALRRAGVDELVNNGR